MSVATQMAPHPDFAWLKEMAYNDYSQFGEDGVLQAIFSVIRAENEWAFECGATDGLFFSNTRRLIEQGWTGILVEADDAAFARLQQNTAAFGDRVKCIHQKAERLDPLLNACGAPLDIDLVVIDVDGQDYHLFNSLLHYRPRVVMIEFDRYADEDFIPVRNGPGQAGAVATTKLGEGKTYELVHANFCNLIFVRQNISRLLRGKREDFIQ